MSMASRIGRKRIETVGIIIATRVALIEDLWLLGAGGRYNAPFLLLDFACGKESLRNSMHAAD